MRLLLVGGDTEIPRPSKIVNMLASNFDCETKVYNGCLPDTLNMYDLVIWMPNIPNEEEKIHLKKDKSAIMIISKVIHGDRTEVDAVSRIFDFGANAVICIYKDELRYRFKLIDALGNDWIETSDIKMLAACIKYRFYPWSKGQIRMSFVQGNMNLEDIKLPDRFIKMNTALADKIETQLNTRYFGNFSTRCMSLFPSIRWGADSYLFSPRNIDKRRIGERDFVLIRPPYYHGGRRYSVDAPVQIMLYRQFPDINYMIHGHAFITDRTVRTTNEYYPCGDLREVEEVAKLFRAGDRMCNLKNHGFLITAVSLKEIDSLINSVSLKPHNILSE